MKPYLITCVTSAGGKLFAVVEPSMPAGRRGALAHSATIAGLVPFADHDLAVAAFVRVGIDPAQIEVPQP